MPTHVRAGLAGQEQGRALEVVGRAPAARGDPFGDTPQPLGVVEQGLVHVGGDVPGRDAVDRDAPARPLVGERLGHLRDAALGGGVGGHGDAALKRQEAAKVDDAAPSAQVRFEGREVQHVRGDVAAQREGRVEVDLQDLGKVGVGEGLGGVAPLDAGAVDQQADLVAVGEDGGHQGGDRGG